jgi:hypothetical protein
MQLQTTDALEVPMAKIFIIGGWIAAAAAIVISALFGPAVAALTFAAGAFALIAALMLAQVVRGIDEWRLNHPWRLPLRK